MSTHNVRRVIDTAVAERRLVGPPRLQAQLPTGLASRPTRRGTRPPQVLMAQGAKGRSRQAGPSGQSTNQTRSEHVKGTGGEGRAAAARSVRRRRAQGGEEALALVQIAPKI